MIKVFVLTTNEIIITDTDDIVQSGFILIHNPALLYTKRSSSGHLGFTLQAWVPNELLKSTDVALCLDKIMAEIQISSALEMFYKNWSIEEIDKIKVYADVFEKQVKSIEKKYMEREFVLKDLHKKISLSSDSILTDALTTLFDDPNNVWGDPTTSH